MPGRLAQAPKRAYPLLMADTTAVAIVGICVTAATGVSTTLVTQYMTNRREAEKLRHERWSKDVDDLRTLFDDANGQIADATARCIAINSFLQTRADLRVPDPTPNSEDLFEERMTEKQIDPKVRPLRSTLAKVRTRLGPDHDASRQLYLIVQFEGLLLASWTAVAVEGSQFDPKLARNSAQYLSRLKAAVGEFQRAVHLVAGVSPTPQFPNAPDDTRERPAVQ
jgi:hypothetical protein